MSFKSKFAPLGIPFVHIATPRLEDGIYRRGVARGWIAIGDISFGILFSCGGVALGTGISVGGLSLGLITLGGLALGGFCIGGCAIGYMAMGGCAIAWHAAVGGCAIAFDYAIGGAAIAENANNEAAKQFFTENAPARIGQIIADHSRWIILLIFLPLLLTLSKRFQPGQSEIERERKNKNKEN